MRKIAIMMIVAIFMAVVVGCSNSQPAATQFKDAVAKQKDMKSYSFEGDMKLSLNVPDEAITQLEGMYPPEMVKGIVDAVNGATLKWEGKYEADPLRGEGTVHLNVPYNGAGFTFDIPLILNGEDMYMKIPMVSDKYVHVNIAEEMNKATGETLDLKEEMKKQYELQTNVMNVVESELKEFFTVGDKKAYTLADGKVDSVVTFEVKQENAEAFLKKVLGTVAPKVIEELKKSSYLDDQSKDQLEQYEQPTEQEINDMVAEFQKSITINKAKVDSVIDKKGFLRKTIVNLDINADVPDMGKGQIGITVNSTNDNINEKVEFKLPVPKDDETIEMEELGMMAPAGF